MSMDTPYGLGYSAALDNRFDCPYEKDDPLWEEWMDGFDRGIDDLVKVLGDKGEV